MFDIQSSASGALVVSGELTFKNARQAAAAGEAALHAAPQQRLQIDCTSLSRVDSAGIAVLIEWLRYARRSGRELRYQNLPASALAIARISELEPLLLARD